ncbi:MAG: TIGR03560 family F420-dependent LLM class oxidoreductase [Chloroflexi bacterium]|nr:TIGR03560 family F420-dependent LLM class oxidoreductase [Chloroflexota bacterium]
MEFGIHLVQQNTTIEECRQLWRWADTAGFTWVDVSDHFYESPMTEKRGPYLECLASLAALAIDTEQVRVGTCVLAMDYRHPAVLANALATIDHLADGRLDVGLGAGWNVQEYEAYGIQFDRIGQRMDRLEEGIHVLRALWEEPVANYSGEYFQLDDALCEPKPLQDRVPIWIGGVGERRTLQLVARYAGGWNAPYLTVADWQRLSGVLDEWCERVGRDPSQIQRDVNLSFHLAADESDRPRAQAHFEEVFGPAGDAFRQRGAIVGTPAEAIDMLADYADAGVDRVNITLRPPWDWDALQAFSNEVIPELSR